MEVINGYRLLGELVNTNSGFARWGFAKKDGIVVFIKEFLSPVYPLDATVLSKEQILGKREICKDFEMKKRKFYKRLNECRTGNIVTVLDFFRFGTRYYTITEKVETAKIDLEEVAKLPFEQKLLIIKIIMHCINTLHLHGIVHGDLKPDNILLKKTKKNAYTAKIIDFDSSFLEAEPPANSDELHGDMVYFAPEAFLFMAEMEGGVLTRKADVFALGIILHQYLSGELPGFDRSQYDYIYEAVLDGSMLQIHPSIPVHLGQLLLRMMAKNPDDRPTLDEAYAVLARQVIERKTVSPERMILKEKVVVEAPSTGKLIMHIGPRTDKPKMPVVEGSEQEKVVVISGSMESTVPLHAVKKTTESKTEKNGVFFKSADDL